VGGRSGRVLGMPLHERLRSKTGRDTSPCVPITTASATLACSPDSPTLYTNVCANVCASQWCNFLTTYIGCFFTRLFSTPLSLASSFLRAVPSLHACPPVHALTQTTHSSHITAGLNLHAPPCSSILPPTLPTPTRHRRRRSRRHHRHPAHPFQPDPVLRAPAREGGALHQGR